MSGTFAGRAALVTGGSSGLGRAIALRLGKAGMEQWLVGRSRQGLDETATMIAAEGGGPVHCEVLDLQQRGAIAKLIAHIDATHPHLFAVINNAGLMHPEPIMSGRMDRWEAMFDVNVLAPLEACRAAVEVMRRHGRPGHLINISSLAGRQEAGGVYGATKLALEMIGRALRIELEHDDIRVTTIVPGGFATQLGRALEPESVEALMAAAARKGRAFGPTADERVLGDPDHVARAVVYVLEQPTLVNVQEIVIRPPVSIEF